MNFNNEIFNNLEEAHRRRVEFFTQHHDEDDENLNVNEKIDLFNSLIEKKGEQGLVVLTRFKITEFKHIVEICKESLNCCSKKGRTCKLNITDKMLVHTHTVCVPYYKAAPYNISHTKILSRAK